MKNLEINQLCGSTRSIFHYMPANILPTVVLVVTGSSGNDVTRRGARPDDVRRIIRLAFSTALCLNLH